MLRPVLLGLSLTTTASAAPETLATVEGLHLNLAPCVAELDAACWQGVRELTRFAGDPRVSDDEGRARVRLAREGERLLLRVDALPEGTTVELVVHPPGKDAITTIDGSARVGLGLHPIDLTAAPRAGELRRLRLALITETGERLGWTPVGPGAAEDTVWAVISDHAPRTRAVPSLTRDRGLLTIHADGASQVRVRELDAATLHPREALLDPPFSLIGTAPLQLPEPTDRGSYAIETIWTADGLPSQIDQRRVVLPGSMPPGASREGIFPAPKQLYRGTGPALDAERLNRICIDDDAWMPQAVLLAEELRRLADITLPVERCRPGRRRISLGVEDGEREAFSLTVDRDRVHLGAGSRRAATWAGHALVDLLVHHDNHPPSLRIQDAPDLDERVLVHRIDGRHRAARDLDEHAEFLRRVVSRGRYSAVVLVLRGGFEYASHPELAQTQALTPEQLDDLLAVLDDLDVEAIPGLNSPGHADWLLGAHPHLREDQNTRLICTRHRDTWPLIRELIDELIEVFDADRIHLGADETWWGSARHGPHERCPRCSSTPRPDLFADHLNRQLDHVRARGVRPMLWSDMLTPKWNGSTEDVHTARHKLDLRGVDLLAWSDIGEGARVLGAEGHRVLQVPTGLHPARTRPIADGSPLDGAGLALFVPRPWQVGGWGAARHRALWSHTPNVMLAGLLGWRRDLATADPDVIAVQLAAHPALRPGAQQLPRPSKWLEPVGPPDPDVPSEPLLPERLRAQGERPAAVHGESGEVIHIPVGRTASTIGLLHAIDLDRDAEIKLESAFSQAPTRSGAPVAQVTVHYEDGSTEQAPLHQGRSTWSGSLDPGALGLWTSQFQSVFTSPRSPFQVSDQQRSLWVHDLARPDQAVREVRVEPVSGARVRVTGALVWD